MADGRDRAPGEAPEAPAEAERGEQTGLKA